jgi:hypothetical protein
MQLYILPVIKYCVLDSLIIIFCFCTYKFTAYFHANTLLSLGWSTLRKCTFTIRRAWRVVLGRHTDVCRSRGGIHMSSSNITFALAVPLRLIGFFLYIVHSVHCRQAIPNNSNNKTLNTDQKIVPFVSWMLRIFFLSPTPSSVEVKDRVELYLYYPSVPSCQVIGRTLHLLLTVLCFSAYTSLDGVHMISCICNVQNVHIFSNGPTECPFSKCWANIKLWLLFLRDAFFNLVSYLHSAPPICFLEKTR